VPPDPNSGLLGTVGSKYFTGWTPFTKEFMMELPLRTNT